MITVYQVHAGSEVKPYLAMDQDTHQQWLGDGFYFWEHPVCAKIWDTHLKQYYSIKNAKVYQGQIPFLIKRGCFIDLVSSTDDMINFYTLASKIRKSLQKEKGSSNFSLNYIFKKLHEQNILKDADIIGVRMSSPWYRHKIPVAHIPKSDSKQQQILKPEKENFFFIQKIQFCIFSFAIDEILNFKEYEFSVSDKENFKVIGV